MEPPLPSTPSSSEREPADSQVIEDFINAWLDSQTAPAAQAPPSHNGDEVIPAESLSQVMARTALCARLIEDKWPTASTGGPSAAHDSLLLRRDSLDSPAGPAGVRLGRYLIEEELGRGRFGVVYRARDDRLQRVVAVKVARPEVSMQADLAQRFLREAALAAKLDHPGIVPVHDAGEADGQLYYVMPYVEGEDLSRRQASGCGPFDPRTAAELLRQVADAIHYGHTQGVIHRDLKPANILLVPQPRSADGRPPGLQARILDFGLARLLESDFRETRSSMILGTPLYMSPEQCAPDRRGVGPAGDIFSLGAILYELLTGEPPFAAESLPQVLERLAAGVVVPPGVRRAGIDPRLEQICLKCLRLHPEDRYATARELADDLARMLAGEAVQARRPTWFDHVRWWARRPQRIADAGAALIVVNLPLGLGMFFFGLGPLIDPGGSMDSLRVQDIMPSLLPGALIGVALAWIGRRVALGSRWALWVATSATAIQWMLCFAVLFLGVPALDVYAGNPMAKWVMYLFLQLLFSLNLGIFLIALHADRYRHQSN